MKTNKNKPYLKAASVLALAVTLGSAGQGMLGAVGNANEAPEGTPAHEVKATPAAETPVTEGSVIVQYVDENKNVIQSNTVSAPLGETITVTAPATIGYRILDMGNTGQVVSGPGGGFPWFMNDGTGAYQAEAATTPTVVQFNYVKQAMDGNVTFTDVTENKVLESRGILGYYGFGWEPGFGIDWDTELANYESQGYELSDTDYDPSNPVPEPGTRDYHINLKHKIVSTPESYHAERKISYYTDGNKEIAKDTIQKLDFTRSYDEDQVTGKGQNTPWVSTSGSNILEGFDVPAVKGYTPNIKSIPEVAVDPETGAYTPFTSVYYAPNAESAKVQVVDGHSGKVLKEQEVKGRFGQSAKVDSKAIAKEFTDGNYTFDNTEIKDGVINFDFDGEVPVYKVTLGHKTQKDVVTQTTKRTINYTTKGSKEFMPKSVVQSATWETGTIKDLVTGEVTKVSDKLVSGDSNFAKVATPAVKGYTSDKAEVKAMTVEPGDKNSTETITYAANPESATVNFTDNGKVVKSVELKGLFNDEVSVPKDVLKELTDGHYTFNADSASFKLDKDGEPKVVNIELGHETKSETETKTVERTVNAVEKGTDKVLDSTLQKVIFTKVTTTDLVTGEVTVRDFEDSLVMDAVKMAVKGYHAVGSDQSTSLKVSSASGPITENVYFEKDAPKPVKPAEDNKDNSSHNTPAKESNAADAKSEATSTSVNKAEAATSTEAKTDNAADSKSEAKSDKEDTQTNVSATHYGLFAMITTIMAALAGAFAFKRKGSK